MSGRELVVATRDTAEVVLASDLVTPPARPGGGATLALRGAMARFAALPDHAARREEVVSAVAGIDVARAVAAAVEIVRSRLGPDVVDAVALADEVPVTAVAVALGLVDSDGGSAAALRADVEAMVAVIGRGAPESAGADAATRRLLALADDHPAGAVPLLSILYQCRDATAALTLTELQARATGSPRVPAVPRTRRVATERGRLGTVDVETGDELVIELGRVGLEFGSGPHACPGRALAVATAEAIVATVVDAGYAVVDGSVALDADGRPVTMSLERSARPARAERAEA